MILLTEIALKTSAIFVLAFGALLLLRRQSAALRHCVLAATFFCALAVPTLTLLAPAWSVTLPASWLSFDTGSRMTFSSASAPAAALLPQPAANRDQTKPRSELSTRQIVSGVWLAGALGGIAVVMTGMWRVRRLGRAASPLNTGPWRQCCDHVAASYGVRQPVQLLHSTHPTMLMTWGIVRPRILVPATAYEWSEDRIRIVLGHELAHVKRGDWAILIAANLLRSFHWFNPLVWIACRRLRQESEQATDDLVLQRGVAAADYASHLLEVARETVHQRHMWSPATAIAHPSTLEGRVRAMLNERLNRTPLTAIGRWTAALASLSATLVIAGAGISVLAAPADVTLPATPVQDALQASTPVVTASRVVASSERLELHDATVTVGGDRLAAAKVVIELAAAQAGPGAVNGVLYDPLGGLLPGASVTLVSRPDGGRYDTTTDRNGAFSFNVLPPGDYELTTSLPGFATVNNLVKVVSGATIERSITMPIGTLQETISVTGGDGPYSAPGPRPPARPARQRPAPEPRTFFSGGIGGQIRVPNKIVNVNPIYPPDAGRATDVVVLTGRVGIDGFLSDLREVSPAANIIGPSHASFVASALDAVRQWEFTPTLLNNVPVEVHITIRVDYRWQ